MNRKTAIMKGLRNFVATATMTVAFMAMGFSLDHVSASQTVNADTTAVTAPAKPVKKAKVTKAGDPKFKVGKIVSFDSPYEKGTIVIVSQTHNLYYILGGGRAVKYRVATAKDGFEWSGTHKVSRKVEWPDWYPPEEMRQRRPELPEHMAGGPENPLGARAIYLGSSLYRIHGTNEPSSIGRPASSGCIRMLNEAVTELYTRVKVGDTVIVM
ncbi:MAG: L,D-transpeptidase [Hyphomicrobiales bacterium]